MDQTDAGISSRFSAPEQDDDRHLIGSFKWSDSVYTPRQIAESFQQSLPLLIQVTAGYLGNDECMEDIPSQQMFWLKDIVTLSRVVAVNEKGAYFSIPATCKTPVVPLLRFGGMGNLENLHKAGNQTTLRTLIEEDMTKAFQFIEDGNFTYNQEPRGEPVRLGVLRIADRYEERYLLAYAVNKGVLYPDASPIPVYLPITLAIAVGMATGDRNQFYKEMMDLHKQADPLPTEIRFHRRTLHYHDIAVFKQKPDTTNYDVSKPYKSLRHGNCRASNIYIKYSNRSVKKKGRMDQGSPMSGLPGSGSSKADDKLQDLLLELQQVFLTGVIPGTSLCGKEKIANLEQEMEDYTPLIKHEMSQSRKENTLSARESNTQNYLNLSPLSDQRMINTLDDVPNDLSELDCDAVGQCLELIGLGHHREKFHKELIDGVLLAALDCDTLQNDLGFGKFEALKLHKFISGWRPK